MKLIMLDDASGVVRSVYFPLQRMMLSATETCEVKGWILCFELIRLFPPPFQQDWMISFPCMEYDQTPWILRFREEIWAVSSWCIHWPHSFSSGVTIAQETASHWFKPPTYRWAISSLKTPHFVQRINIYLCEHKGRSSNSGSVFRTLLSVRTN